MDFMDLRLKKVASATFFLDLVQHALHQFVARIEQQWFEQFSQELGFYVQILKFQGVGCSVRFFKSIHPVEQGRNFYHRQFN